MTLDRLYFDWLDERYIFTENGRCMDCRFKIFDTKTREGKQRKRMVCAVCGCKYLDDYNTKMERLRESFSGKPARHFVNGDEQ